MSGSKGGGSRGGRTGGGSSSKHVENIQNLSDQEVAEMWILNNQKENGVNFETIQQKIRNGDELTLAEKTAIDKINELAEKSPSVRGKLYRMNHFDSESQAEKFDQDFQSGRLYTFKQPINSASPDRDYITYSFGSWSIGGKSSQDVMLHINTKTAKDISRFQTVHSGEREHLLNPQKKYLVINKWVDSNGQKNISLEER